MCGGGDDKVKKDDPIIYSVVPMNVDYFTIQHKLQAIWNSIKQYVYKSLTFLLSYDFLNVWYKDVRIKKCIPVSVLKEGPVLFKIRKFSILCF